MAFVYLGGLSVGLAGMVVLDLRFRLFFRRAPLRAAIVLALGMAFFLVWDLAGIHARIFFPGDAAIVTGVLLAPGLPLEEVFFLALLCYTAMNLYGWLTRGSSGRRSRRIETSGPGDGGLDTPPGAATRPAQGEQP